MIKIALVPGHNSYKGRGDSGCSVSFIDSDQNLKTVTEFELMKRMVADLWCELTMIPEARFIVTHRGLETGAYSKLPKELNALEPDLILEFHLNAAGNTNVQGSEVLYWHKSARSKKLADIVQGHLVRLMKLKDRGLKPITVNDRGANILRNTKAPTVIVEGFFLSNVSSEMQLETLMEDYKNAMKCALIDIVKEFDK